MIYIYKKIYSKPIDIKGEEYALNIIKYYREDTADHLTKIDPNFKILITHNSILVSYFGKLIVYNKPISNPNNDETNNFIPNLEDFEKQLLFINYCDILYLPMIANGKNFPQILKFNPISLNLPRRYAYKDRIMYIEIVKEVNKKIRNIFTLYLS